MESPQTSFEKTGRGLVMKSPTRNAMEGFALKQWQWKCQYQFQNAITFSKFNVTNKYYLNDEYSMLNDKC